VQSCRTLLAINAERIKAPEQERFDFVIAVATGAMPGFDEIAGQLRGWSYRDGESCGEQPTLPGTCRLGVLPCLALL